MRLETNEPETCDHDRATLHWGGYWYWYCSWCDHSWMDVRESLDA